MLLCLRVHHSVEIKRNKNRIRIASLVIKLFPQNMVYPSTVACNNVFPDSILMSEYQIRKVLVRSQK